jgi:hypothetical protein
MLSSCVFELLGYFDFDGRRQCASRLQGIGNEVQTIGIDPDVSVRFSCGSDRISMR